MKKLHLALLGLLIAALAAPLVQAADDTVTVYSSRKEHLIKPLFDAYRERTGIEIRYVTDKAGPLLARLQAELPEGRRRPTARVAPAP